MLRAPLFAGVEKICVRSTIVTNSCEEIPPNEDDFDAMCGIGGEDEILYDIRGEPMGRPIHLPTLRVLNLSNATCDNFFALVMAPNLNKLVLSGVRGSCSIQMVDFIQRARDSLVELDVSRTSLGEAEFESVLRTCKNLEVVVATELRWRGVEDNYMARYPKVKVIFRLLSHWLEPIKKRREDVACLYDVDGKGCSLLADAIYVGIKIDVIKYILEEFKINVNRFGCLTPPWVLPYPTKVVESFEQLRAPLALHQALLLNKFDIAGYLIAVGADPNLRTNDGYTAAQCLLHCPTLDATSRNNGILFLLSLPYTRFDSATIRMCVERQLPLAILERIAFTSVPADDRSRNDYFLFTAAARDNHQLCSTLIERLGADPSALFPNEPLRLPTANASVTALMDTSLLISIKNSAVASAEVIIMSWGLLVGPHALSNLVTYRDAKKLTSIHYAIVSCPTDRVERLLKLLMASVEPEEAGQLRMEVIKFVWECHTLGHVDRSRILDCLQVSAS
jgi:hypothetical protein